MAIEPLSMNDVDGIKLNFKDGWLLVRASGTEPKIRVTAEAKSKERLKYLYNSGVDIISKYIEIGQGGTG